MYVSLDLTQDPHASGTAPGLLPSPKLSIITENLDERAVAIRRLGAYFVDTLRRAHEWDRPEKRPARSFSYKYVPRHVTSGQRHLTHVSLDQYAILLDGGFVVAKLKQTLRRFPTADDIMDACARVRNDALLRELRLLRIYFYNAPPYQESIVNPISKARLKAGPRGNAALYTSLHGKLELMPDVALRMGITVCHGFRLARKALSESDGKRPLMPDDLIPHIEQKGVDLRIGLDIARLALKRLVSTIVVVSGDSDFVPAFKFARREGLRVFLDVMGHGVRREMKVHADRIIDAAGLVERAKIARDGADQRAPEANRQAAAWRPDTKNPGLAAGAS